MNKITIFANGVISPTDFSLEHNQRIIAVDGGVRHCLKLGITPEIVIGDFDSITDEDICSLESDGVKLIRYPVDKDETDLELALDYAVKNGATDITLYGLLGGRWDMTFANILLLSKPSYARIKFKIVDGKTSAHILREGESLNISGQPGTIISVLPLSKSTSGVTYRGLKWPLEDVSLPFGTPRGVSNLMVESKARITLRSGILLVFVIDQPN